MNATVKESVQAMIANPGVYVCGDTGMPAGSVVIASVDGHLYQMRVDGELKPDLFFDTFVVRSGPHK